MNSENSESESASQAVRFQDAQAMFNQGQLVTRRYAAAVAEMAESTFKYRLAGRRLAEEYGKTRRLLTAEEESILLWRCDILQLSGWLQTPKDVRILALEIVQKRDPNAKVGNDWVRSSLYKRCNYISVMVVNSTFTLCLPLARRERKPPGYDHVREPHVMLRESKNCQNVAMYENCM